MEGYDIGFSHRARTRFFDYGSEGFRVRLLKGAPRDFTEGGDDAQERTLVCKPIPRAIAREDFEKTMQVGRIIIRSGGGGWRGRPGSMFPVCRNFCGMKNEEQA